MVARRLLHWSLWVLIVLAAVIALAVGSSRQGHPTLDQRTHSLAAQVRCPVCSGESAADSQVSAAVDIRNEIRRQLSAGVPPRRVLDRLVGVYGTGILEKPQARGIGLVAWVLPIAVAAVAATGLVVAFLRWRRPPSRSAGGCGDEDRALVDAARTAVDHPPAP